MTAPALSFDGFGVNDRDCYATRIATLNRTWANDEDREKIGRLFAAAPDLLAALRSLVARVDAMQLPDGATPDTLGAHVAISMAEHGCWPPPEGAE